mgnify:FL=1
MPLTHKAKNKLREAGTDQVEIIDTRRDLFGQSGEWLHVAFVGANRDKSRWVHSDNDLDFVVLLT